MGKRSFVALRAPQDDNKGNLRRSAFIGGAIEEPRYPRRSAWIRGEPFALAEP
jgi:hypothetical protein